MKFDFDEHYKVMEARSLIQRKYEWDKWSKEIPYLQFKPDWEVKVIPPSTGAVIRFLVRKGEYTVSVYLDCYGELGACDEPYWEIYPDFEGDNSRFYINETDELIQAIDKSLNEREEGVRY